MQRSHNLLFELLRKALAQSDTRPAPVLVDEINADRLYGALERRRRRTDRPRLMLLADFSSRFLRAGSSGWRALMRPDF